MVNRPSIDTEKHKDFGKRPKISVKQCPGNNLPPFNPPCPKTPPKQCCCCCCKKIKEHFCVYLEKDYETTMEKIAESTSTGGLVVPFNFFKTFKTNKNFDVENHVYCVPVTGDYKFCTQVNLIIQLSREIPAMPAGPYFFQVFICKNDETVAEGGNNLILCEDLEVPQIPISLFAKTCQKFEKDDTISVKIALSVTQSAANGLVVIIESCCTVFDGELKEKHRD